MAEAKFNISQGGLNNKVVTVIFSLLIFVVILLGKETFTSIKTDLSEIKATLKPFEKHISQQEIYNKTFTQGIEENKDEIKELKENKKYSRTRGE